MSQDWIEEARQLRREGWPTKKIASHLHKWEPHVREVIKDLPLVKYQDDWIEQARAMRAEGLPLREIAKRVKRCARNIAAVVGDVQIPKHSTEWIQEARQMRTEGHGLAVIARKIHRSVARVQQVVGDIPFKRGWFGAWTPEQRKNSNLKKKLNAEKWHPKARELRAQGMTIKEIAKEIHVCQTQVSKAVKDVVCPVDHSKKTLEKLRHILSEKRKQDQETWHKLARQMRAEGAHTKDICAAVNRSSSVVLRLVKDVPCPVDHIAEAARRTLAARRVAQGYTPLSHEQAEAKRAKMAEARAQARALKSTQNEEQIAAARAAAEAKRIENAKRKLAKERAREVERQLKLWDKIEREQEMERRKQERAIAKAAPKKPVLGLEDQVTKERKNKMAMLLGSDNQRARAPITLPKLSIMEAELAD